MPTKNMYESMAPADIALGQGLFRARRDLNRAYLLSLKPDNILQNHYLEAGLGSFGQIRNTVFGGPGDSGDGRHWGWESPTCQVRGQFLGHWLSAAARLAAGGDAEIKLRADHVVAELARCQEKNGGEWAFSIPEKYLRWTAQGRPTWSPQYVCHKTLMGLLDMHACCGSRAALAVAERAARWFHRWTKPFAREQMDDILETETGGMLEAWANLYGVTRSREHLDLIERYTRRRLFDPLLAGRDVLTNMHANTTIPEIHGAARAYEATGNERWRKIVEAYWACAVDRRGAFATGGQTAGEIWTPPFEYAARRGDKNQEHCVVFNMIRLADYLFRWTGDAKYPEYVERNLYNGVLAQQHPRTGMISYFLPLAAGARKAWGSPTCDFWCCHGTLVQAHTLHEAWIYFRGRDEIAVCQFIPSSLRTEIAGKRVHIELTIDEQATGAADNNASAAGSRHRPDRLSVHLAVACPKPLEFSLSLRIPGWVRKQPTLTLNGKPHPVTGKRPGFLRLRRRWRQDTIRLELPKGLAACAIPDEPDTVAFLDGPVVLAGLCDREITLYGDKARPDTILKPDNERQWGTWLSGYRTVGQPVNLLLRPLHEIVDEPYTVYFPIQRQQRQIVRAQKGGH